MTGAARLGWAKRGGLRVAGDRIDRLRIGGLVSPGSGAAGGLDPTTTLRGSVASRRPLTNSRRARDC
ncbi:MAG TPA: hypothetical protein PKD53_19725 [Chloroflexaceae bacterium]|nr:hypothetical protein [Chloroflexaceae bacterium]